MTRESFRTTPRIRAAAAALALLVAAPLAALPSSGLTRPLDAPPRVERETGFGSPPVRLAQAGSPQGPDETYTGIRGLRLAVDLIELPGSPTAACGVDETAVRAATEAAFRGTGIRFVAGSPGSLAEADRALPELSVVAIVLAAPGSCDIVLQVLLAAPVTDARITATGRVFARAEVVLWTHSSATRKTVAEARRELPALLGDALRELGRDIVWANLPAGSPRPLLSGERDLMVRPVPAPTPVPTPMPAARSVAPCPDRWRDLGVVPPRLECSCTTAAVARSGPVWGTGVYTDDSALCRAALHAGAVPAAGGTVTVLREGARDAFPGSVRNGVSTSNYGAWGGSFRFEVAPPAAMPAAAGAKPPPAPPTGSR